MIELDLTGPDRYHPLDALSAEEVFELGLRLVQAMPQLRVRAPAGDAPDEAVTLDGRLLSKKGVAVF